MVTTLTDVGIPARLGRLLAILGIGLVALAAGGTLVLLVGLRLLPDEGGVVSGRAAVALYLVAAAVPFVVALALERLGRRWYDPRVRLLVASVVGALSVVANFLVTLMFTLGF